MITVSRTFETAEDAAAWLKGPEPAPAAVRAGPVTEEEVNRAVDRYFPHRAGIPGSVRDTLTDFLNNRGISTEPAEFTKEQINNAWREYYLYPGCEHDRMHAALRAAGARP